jgi:hypothetical protein
MVSSLARSNATVRSVSFFKIRLLPGESSETCKKNISIARSLFQTRLPRQLHHNSGGIVPTLRIRTLTKAEKTTQATVALNNRNLIADAAKAELGKCAGDISRGVHVGAGEKVTQ